MRVLASACSGKFFDSLVRSFPGAIGWMMSPATGYKQPRESIPYAIDNGKYAAYVNGVEWSELAFISMLDKCHTCEFQPLWIVVPDEVGNSDKTLELWKHYEKCLRRYKRPLAFVAQDGMTPRDVPRSADLVFIGGSTNWKWRNVAHFAATFDRVHVGRVNWHDKLEYCLRLGIESVDGSGWFRQGDGPRVQQLVEFLSGRRRYDEQPQLAFK